MPVKYEPFIPPSDDQLTIEPAVPRLEHHPDRVLHAEEHAAQVDVHQLVVVLGRHVGEHRRVGEAGDVQHRVEAAELLDRGAHQRLDVGFVRDVAVDGQHAVADLGRGVLLGAADVGGDDRGALADEDLHRRPWPSPTPRR